jgi:3-methyladenine DNA glycosylase AlkC
MEFLLELAKHENENVRRFASEGCRPRLPWAMALPQFKKDPSPIIPILAQLKDDESEFVRRSVANNLNDISKDNPDLVLKLSKKWLGKSERRNWIIKHASRTMLKAGNKRALMLFGYGNPKRINVQNFEVKTKKVKIGDYLKFSFKLNVKNSQKSKLRLEYAIDYLKANNLHNKKVFQISENIYSPGDHFFSKKHSFAEMTTRKHYPGLHKVSIVVNGEIKSTQSFQVK